MQLAKMNKIVGRTWNIGPLCLYQCSFEATTNGQTQQPTNQAIGPLWLEWLEGKLRQGDNVLYMAFGTQSEISSEQIKEIEIGLEESGVNFLWVRKKVEEEKETMEDKGFEERTKERGIIVIESLSCGVPILTYPLMADQSLNARMVVEELRAGMKAVEGRSLMKGFVKGKDLKRHVKELMEGEEGKEARKKAMEI
uniref:UDP-glycosyltransferases domain-containing protein n=1 Tax=Cucumis sativus TaxID=3659 RepID=A0A0A0KVF7_CUCSA